MTSPPAPEGGTGPRRAERLSVLLKDTGLVHLPAPQAERQILARSKWRPLLPGRVLRWGRGSRVAPEQALGEGREGAPRESEPTQKGSAAQGPCEVAVAPGGHPANGRCAVTAAGEALTRVHAASRGARLRGSGSGSEAEQGGAGAAAAGLQGRRPRSLWAWRRRRPGQRCP